MSIPSKMFVHWAWRQLGSVWIATMIDDYIYTSPGILDEAVPATGAHKLSYFIGKVHHVVGHVALPSDAKIEALGIFLPDNAKLTNDLQCFWLSLVESSSRNPRLRTPLDYAITRSRPYPRSATLFVTSLVGKLRLSPLESLRLPWLAAIRPSSFLLLVLHAGTELNIHPRRGRETKATGELLQVQILNRVDAAKTVASIGVQIRPVRVQQI